MKKAVIVTLSFLIFFTFCVKSQNLVTKTKHDVINYMFKKDPGCQPEWGRDNSGNDYVMFKKSESIYSVYYFNSNDYCIRYVSIHPYSDMNTVIEYLNSVYTIYKDNKWIDYNKDYDYIWWIEREEDFFAVQCKIYEIH